MPLVVKRTWSAQGTAATSFSASSTALSLVVKKVLPWPTASITAATTAGWEWPRIIGPEPISQSTYWLPLTSQIREPRPSRARNFSDSGKLVLPELPAGINRVALSSSSRSRALRSAISQPSALNEN